MSEEHTLEMYKLIVGPDEIEEEATDTISEYLVERAAFYGNKLGCQHKKVKEFEHSKRSDVGGLHFSVHV